MRIPPTGNSLAGACLLLALTACGPGTAEVKRLRDSCRAGDPAACNEYGQKLLSGSHVLRDDSTAALEFTRACEGNVADGCARLAVLYQSGRGFKKDSARAVPLLQKACEGGAMDGCARLGLLYREGAGIERDVSRASRLFEQSCSGGNLLGCAHLGTVYADGDSTTRDLAKAAELFKKSCDGKVAAGCVGLGRLHAIRAVDPDEAGRQHRLPEDGQLEQLGLRHHPEPAAGDRAEHDRDVVEALVVRHHHERPRAGGVLAPAHPHIKSGTIRGLAVTGSKRWHDLPEIPTMIEAGYQDFVFETYTALVAPAKIPPEIRDQLEKLALGILNRPEMRERLAKSGFEVQAKDGKGHLERVTREVKMYRDIITSAGIKKL